MSVIKVVAAIGVITLLAGCKDIQTCNDSSAKNSVLKIITDNSLKYVQKGATAALNAVNADAMLADIKTTDSNEQLGAYECSANYVVKYNNQQQSVPIAYKLSHLEDSNSTQAEVFLDDVTNLFSHLSRLIQGEKGKKYAQIFGDYETEQVLHNRVRRGMIFTNWMRSCMHNKISTSGVDTNGDFKYTANDLADWDKTCTAKADEYVKLVSNYVVNRGSAFSHDIAICIESKEYIYSAGNGDRFYTYTLDQLAEWDKSCTLQHPQ